MQTAGKPWNLQKQCRRSDCPINLNLSTRSKESSKVHRLKPIVCKEVQIKQNRSSSRIHSLNNCKTT